LQIYGPLSGGRAPHSKICWLSLFYYGDREVSKKEEGVKKGKKTKKNRTSVHIKRGAALPQQHFVDTRSVERAKKKVILLVLLVW
jgi:hypothetical protein